MASIISSGPIYIGETFDGQFMVQSDISSAESEPSPTAQKVEETLWQHFNEMEKIQASRYDTTSLPQPQTKT